MPELLTRIVPPLDIASPPEQVAQVKLTGTIAAELLETDQFAMPDRPMSEETREAWRVYRQALRDLSKLPGTTADKWAAWPARPDGKPRINLEANFPAPPPVLMDRPMFDPPSQSYDEWIREIKGA